MAIYEIATDGIRPLPTITFEQARLRERSDLQRLLRERIDVVAPDTMVLAEEYGNWEDCRRRIDLLALDKNANLVVVELKRTEDGGHMELQAIRYAAMIAGMTFAEAVDAHAAYLQRLGRDSDAQPAILEFLEWDEPDEENFAQEVRIVLVSADFSKELTTAVMWLNERDLDIRCVRITPHNYSGRVLADVQQIIPLPEAEDYQVRRRAKAEMERTARREESGRKMLYQRFWTGLLAKARERTNLHAGISPSTECYISASARSNGLSLRYVLGRYNRLELYMDTGDRDRNKAIYDQIAASRTAIEEQFGAALGWRRLGEEAERPAKASIIEYELPNGSVQDEADWPGLQDQMIDAMVRFEAALRPAIEGLQG